MASFHKAGTNLPRRIGRREAIGLLGAGAGLGAVAGLTDGIGFAADERTQTHAETFDTGHDFPLFSLSEPSRADVTSALSLYHRRGVFAVIIIPAIGGRGSGDPFIMQHYA